MEWGISVRRPNAPTQPLTIWLCPTNKAWICTCYLFTEICAISFACLMEGWWRNACSCSVCWTVGKRYVKLKQESNEVTVVRMGRKEASLLSKYEPSSRDSQLFSLQPFPSIPAFQSESFLFLKFRLQINFPLPVTLCLNSPPVAYKIETSFCCAPDHEKQSCWGWLVLQRVNIFHWCLQVVIYCTIIYWLNRWMLHWVTNETAFEACTSFAISWWKIWLWVLSASSSFSQWETWGIFSSGLAHVRVYRWCGGLR